MIPKGVETALDDTYDRADGEEPPRWHEQVTSHGMPHIRATVVRDGDTLRIETNSAERMDRALTTLVRLDPAMRVLDDARHPIRDAREAAELAAQLPVAEDALDPADPEVAEMLDEFIREYEAKWLDEPTRRAAQLSRRCDPPTRATNLH